MLCSLKNAQAWHEACLGSLSCIKWWPSRYYYLWSAGHCYLHSGRVVDGNCFRVGVYTLLEIISSITASGEPEQHYCATCRTNGQKFSYVIHVWGMELGNSKLHIHNSSRQRRAHSGLPQIVGLKSVSHIVLMLAFTWKFNACCTFHKRFQWTISERVNTELFLIFCCSKYSSELSASTFLRHFEGLIVDFRFGIV